MNTFKKITAVVIITGISLSCSNSNRKEANDTYEFSDMAIADESAETTQESSLIRYAPSAPMENMEVSNMAEESNVRRSIANEKQNPTPNFIASHTASIINNDGVHKLILNAQMKFKVNNVPETTYAIENIVLTNGGHIRRSDIDNRNSYSSTVNISNDSAIVIHHSNLTANIQFRVHYTKLDTVLRAMAPHAVHIDYRTINANDVTINLLREKLKKERMEKKQKRMSSAIDNRGHKLNDIMDAEQALDFAAEQADRALLEDYSMQDQIEYSTVNVELYQNPTQYQEQVLRVKSIDEYKPSMGSKLVSALQFGWNMVAGLFILLISIWPVLLAAGVSIYFYFGYKKRRKE